jgi:hypothetical protein
MDLDKIVFTPGMNLSDALNSAVKTNNSREMDRILNEINEQSYTNYRLLMKDIKMHVKELDPFDEYNTIRYIIDNIRTELQDLLDPVRIIMNYKKKKMMSLCFGGKRT